MANPFDPFANIVISFLVDDPLENDRVDSAGNPLPVKREVTIEAFMKVPKVQYGALETAESFPGLGKNSTRLEGYICGDGKFPVGVNPLDTSSYCKYRDQLGTFTVLLAMQSSVGADSITGSKIVGVFSVVGGE
jgi:hypothetical protein